MIKSLRKKFILINMLLVSAVLIAMFSAQCYTAYRDAEAESVRSLEMALNRKEGQKSPHFEIGQKPPQDFAKALSFVVYLSADNTVDFVKAENISISGDKLEQVVGEVLESGKEQGVLSAYSLRFMVRRDGLGSRIAFVDVSGDITALRNTVLFSALLCAASITVFFMISLFLSRWALRPVEQAWQQQKRFVADASHELKTPLTVILANMGILKTNRASTVEEQIGWVKNTEAEANRMKGLVDDLLFLAKTDDAQHTVVPGRVNLSDTVMSTALTFESLAFERGITLDTGAISPDIFIEGDESQLKRLMGILLDNAVKYSPADGTVDLRLSLRQSKAVLTVRNLAEGLSPEDMERLFDRFYRADPSRSKEGYGLGLSIARNIVKAHGGSITAESAAAGMRFLVELPAGEPKK